MNLQTADLYFGRKETPPPINMSAEEFQKTQAQPIKKPFEVGDLLIPILTPVDSEDHNPRTIEKYLLQGDGPFTVRSINKNHTRVNFVDENGSYDTAFFKKSMSAA